MRKKLLTLLLVSSMILSAVPFTAVSAAEVGTPVVAVEDAAAPFEDFPAADAESGKIVLDKDVTLADDTTVDAEITVAAGKNVTIDLNGHNISSSTAQFLRAEGNVTITNSVPNAGGNITITGASSNAAIRVNGSLTVEKVTLSTNNTASLDSYYLIYIPSSATDETVVSLNDCTLDSRNGPYIHGNTAANPKLRLNNVTINATGTGMYLAGNGTTTITGDTTITSANLGVEIRAGSLNIGDGVTIAGGTGDPDATSAPNGNSAINTGLSIAQHTTGKPVDVNVGAAEISGGAAVYVSSEDQVTPIEVAVSVDGATLTNTADTPANGKALLVEKAGINVTVTNSKLDGEVDTTGTQVILENCTDENDEAIANVTAVATVDGIQYTDWDAAVDAANATKALVLEADKDLGTTPLTAKDITIDLNGHKLNSAIVEGTINVADGNTVTLKDSVGGGSVENRVSGSDAVTVAGALVLTSGTVNGSIDIAATGAVTANGGVVNGSITTAEGGVLTVNGGKFKEAVPTANWGAGKYYAAKDADGYYSYHATKEAARTAAGSNGTVYDIEGDVVENTGNSGNGNGNGGSTVPPYVPAGGSGSGSGSGSGTATTDTGWKKVDNKWFYVNENGVNATGWLKDGGTWYYLFGDGVMATGWQYLGGAWYYLKDSGAMATGWQKVGSTWYFLKDSGAMATGWKLVGGKWYFLKDWGGMATGWQLVNGKWYFMDQSGAMAANTTIDGYKVGADGAWIK